MNAFLQHFSNFNLTNQSIAIYRFCILHQKIYGTNINKTNVKNNNSKNIKRLIKAIEIIPKKNNSANKKRLNDTNRVNDSNLIS